MIYEKFERSKTGTCTVRRGRTDELDFVEDSNSDIF